MNKIFHFLFPHQRNQHRPYLTRYPGLITIFLFLLTVQTTFNLFFSTSPQILGFATSIYQQELITLTNQQREKNGLNTLQHNSTLDEAARLKAIHMFEKDYWAHVSPSGIDPWHWFKVAGYNYLSAGENLARDFDTSNGVVAAWMASFTHQENILYQNFSEIGMAVVNGELNGEDTTLVVQLFATPKPAPELVIQPIKLTQNENPPTPSPPPISTPISNLFNTTSDVSTSDVVSLLTSDVSPEPTTLISPLSTPQTPKDVVNQNRFDPILGPISNKDTPNPPNPLVLTLSILQNLKNLSVSRLLTIVLVSGLIVLFIADSLILWRKGIKRQNAHRIIHVGMLLLILVGILYDAGGRIL